MDSGFFSISAMYGVLLLNPLSSALFTSFSLFLAAATAGGSLLALYQEGRRVLSGKVFHEKNTLQITQATCIVAVIALIVLSAGYFTIDLTGGSFAPPSGLADPSEALSVTSLEGAPAFQTFLPHSMVINLGLPGFLILLLGLCLFVLGKWRKQTALRLAVLVPTACASLLWLACIAGLYAVQFSQVNVFWFESFSAARLLLATIYSFVSGPLFALWALFLGLAAASFISSFWLVLRRNRADYGRDYYNFGLHFLARSGLFSFVGLAIFGGVLAWIIASTIAPIQQEVLLAAAALGVLTLLLCVICARVLKSPTPMRHKASIFLAPFLLLGLAFSPLFILSYYSIFFQ